MAKTADRVSISGPYPECSWRCAGKLLPMSTTLTEDRYGRASTQIAWCCTSCGRQVGSKV